MSQEGSSFSAPLSEQSNEDHNVSVQSKCLKSVKSSKMRSKEYRERKKEYVTILEEKNKELAKENTMLKAEIAHLKKISLDFNSEAKESNDPKLKMRIHENYTYHQMGRMLKEDPEQIRFSQLIMANEDVCEWNEDRIQIIKNSFNDIFEFLISKDNKCCVAANKSIKFCEYLKRMSKKRAYKSKLKEANELHPREVLLDANLSESFLENLKKYGSDRIHDLKMLGKVVKKLVACRNEILNFIEMRKKLYNESKMANAMGKEDFISMCEIVAKLENTKYVSPHFLWDIPVRDPKSNEYKDCELSE